MSARIDMYLQSLIKYNATAVLLAGGGNVTLRFPAGDRFANQSTPQGDLTTIVEQVAPPSQMAELRRGARASFDYEFQDRTFAISVDPKPGQWRVIIEPRASVSRLTVDMPPAPAPVAPAPPPVAAPPAPAARPPPVPTAPAPEPAVATGSLLPIERMLVLMRELSCSDLHLSTNAVPQVRLHGEIKPLGDSYGVLEAEAMMQLLNPIIPDKNRREFEERNDTDFAHAIPGVSRFRANLFRDRTRAGRGVPRHPVRASSAPSSSACPRGCSISAT